MICAVAGEAVGKAWFEYVNGGGEFFSHFVFTFLASVVLSSKWREYLVDPQKDDMDDFRQEVKAEIQKVERCVRMDPQLKSDVTNKFKSLDGGVKELRKKYEDATAGLAKGCKVWCWVALVAIVLVIATEFDKVCGGLCFLGALPVPIYRWRINAKYEELQGDFAKLKENFEVVREICQGQYNDKLNEVDNLLKSVRGRKKVS